MHRISQLYIYPVKSLGGFAVSSAILTDRGLEHDRRWMLVDGQNKFLTQREYPTMALLKTAIINNRLVISDKDNDHDKISVPLLLPPSDTIMVTIWNDQCAAQYVDAAADAWLSRKLSIKCRIVYMPDETQRLVDVRYSKNNEISSFSDDYPLMMIGDASLADLNSRMPEPLPMNRFRPNIVFAGGEPYEEDGMEHFTINNIDFYGVKLCARCPVTTTDQQTALRYKEPLKTLATYRKRNNKVYFGQNLLYNNTGILNIGDKMIVKKWQQPESFNS